MNPTKHRLVLLKAYGNLYTRHMEAGMDSCFYCGDRRECLDHRPPLSVLDVSGPETMREARVPLILLPCCDDCNQRLGSRPLLTALEACEFLRDALEASYEKRATLWSSEEEGEMSPMFQKLIQAKRKVAEQLVDRVRFAQQRALEFELMPEFIRPDA